MPSACQPRPLPRKSRKTRKSRGSNPNNNSPSSLTLSLRTPTPPPNNNNNNNNNVWNVNLKNFNLNQFRRNKNTRMNKMSWANKNPKNNSRPMTRNEYAIYQRQLFPYNIPKQNNTRKTVRSNNNTVRPSPEKRPAK
jgi:hypothetical protein